MIPQNKAIATRRKYRCCYRLKKGKRAGLMCGQEVHFISGFPPSDYCFDHYIRQKRK